MDNLIKILKEAMAEFVENDPKEAKFLIVVLISVGILASNLFFAIMTFAMYYIANITGFIALAIGIVYFIYLLAVKIFIDRPAAGILIVVAMSFAVSILIRNQWLITVLDNVFGQTVFDVYIPGVFVPFIGIGLLAFFTTAAGKLVDRQT